MSSVLHDLRFALRMLARNPGATAVAVISLAIAIGPNCALFSVVDRLFLEPAPILGGGRIFCMNVRTRRPGSWQLTSYPDVLDFQSQAGEVASFAAYRNQGAVLSSSGRRQTLMMREVSENYFSVLGATLPETAAPLAPAPVAAPPAPPVSDTVPFVSPPMSGVYLDSEGLPWDARIHGENRSQTQNGRWKRKRNTPDDLWEQVRAELRNAMGAPAPHSVSPDSPLAAPYAIAPASEPSAAEAFAPLPVAPPPPPAPPAPAVTESPAAAASNAADAFTDLLARVVARQGAGEITTEQVADAAKAVGLNGIRDLMVRPDLIPSFEMVLE